VGLKENIYQAFTKSGGEFELKKDYGKLREGDKVMIEADRGNTPNHTRVKTSEGGVLLMPDSNIKPNPAIDQLSDDLSKAIRDFITAQTFRVDKLTASGGPVSTSPILPVPSAGGPVPVPPRTIPVVTVDVDKDGGPSPAGGGIAHSNNSEVRLRKDEIAKGSL